MSPTHHPQTTTCMVCGHTNSVRHETQFTWGVPFPRDSARYERVTVAAMCAAKEMHEEVTSACNTQVGVGWVACEAVLHLVTPGLRWRAVPWGEPGGCAGCVRACVSHRSSPS